MTVALETISVKTLADLYNLLAETPVKKFADRPTAIKRLNALLEKHAYEVFEVDGEYDVRPIEAPVDIHAASNALIAGAVANNPELAAIVKAPVQKNKGGKRGPAPEFADDMIINVLVANPKRANTASWDRFAMYKDGMTVGDFLAAGGRRADLSWDSDENRKYISITPAK